MFAARTIFDEKTFNRLHENFRTNGLRIQTSQGAVLYFLTHAAEKMRKHALALTVLVSTDRFHPVPAEYINQATYSSTYPTSSDQEMQVWAIKTLGKIFKDGYDYRKAVIILSGFVSAETTSKRMFDDKQFKRQHSLMKAVDEKSKIRQSLAHCLRLRWRVAQWRKVFD